jgi:hypothetical protein
MAAEAAMITNSRRGLSLEKPHHMKEEELSKGEAHM